MYADRVRVAVVAALFGSACSLVYTSAPPEPLPDHGGIACTEMPAAPIVDVLLAPVASTAGVMAALEIDDHARDGGVGLIFASILVVPVAFLASAAVGFSRNLRCHDARRQLRENGRDPLEPVAPMRGADLAHDGEAAAERGDCNVVRAIADQLRAMNELATLDTYVHDTGVAQCMP